MFAEPATLLLYAAGLAGPKGLSNSARWNPNYRRAIEELALPISEQTEESRGFKFPASSIRRIFLGPHMSDQKRNEINEVARLYVRDWAVVRILADPDTAVSTFHGAEITEHADDFDWHSDHALPTDPPDDEPDAT
jgi:hypothetical protein